MQTRVVPEPQSPAVVSINTLIFLEAVKDTLEGRGLETLLCMSSEYSLCLEIGEYKWIILGSISTVLVHFVMSWLREGSQDGFSGLYEWAAQFPYDHNQHEEIRPLSGLNLI